MQISEQLIQRVLSNNAAPEEKEMVAAFFKSNPDKMAQYMTDESWGNFELEDLQLAPRQKMLETLEEKIGKAPVRKMWYKWAAAAVLLIGSASAWLFLKENKQDSIAVVTPVQIESPVVSYTNLSASEKKYKLADGTTVTLGANSVIRFNQPFVHNRRDIYLIGEATFMVAKDKTRPFIVHSRHITTTALGTVFSVNDKQDVEARIRLYEGKIVIKSADSSSRFSDVYLVPGQELVLNKTDFSTQLKTMKPKVAPMSQQVHPAAAITQITFNKTPLQELFTQLESKLGVRITCDSAHIKNMDFTGTFNSSKESLTSFLTTLCDLNELKLEQINSKRFSIVAK